MDIHMDTTREDENLLYKVTTDSQDILGQEFVLPTSTSNKQLQQNLNGKLQEWNSIILHELVKRLFIRYHTVITCIKTHKSVVI